MQAAVPLVYEFQLNGRVELTVLGTGLHQSNLTTTTDLVAVAGVDNNALNSGGTNAALVAAINAAIQAWIIDNKAIPA